MAAELTSDEKLALYERGLKDPAWFCRFFLRDQFPLPMPWVHLGLLAILTKRTEFLKHYDIRGRDYRELASPHPSCLTKILENFVFKDEKGQWQRIFHCFLDGHLSEDYENPSLQIRMFLPGRFVLLLMPRGSGKTAIAGLAVPVYKIAYQLDKFLLYLSKAEEHAKEQLATIRRQLRTNDRFLAVFGNLKPHRTQDERWAAEKFETLSGVAMASKGKGGQIRGINHNQIRPTTILIDDPQALADVESDSQREKDIVWAYSELIPARARIETILGETGQLLALGTKIHKRCIVNIWAKDVEKWTVVEMGVFDRDHEPIWPEFMDAAGYETERRSYALAGLLGRFHMEYDNVEVIEEDIVFPRKYFRYATQPRDEDVLSTATYIDPAFSKKRTADFTFIGTASRLRNGRIRLRDCHLQRGMDEEDKVDEYFRQSRLFKSTIHGIESNAAQVAFASTLRGAMFQKKHYFEIIELHQKQKKTERCKTLIRPKLAAGFIEFCDTWLTLELQLEEFRMDDSHEHDDGPDGLASLIKLLEDSSFAEGDGSVLDESSYPDHKPEEVAWSS